MARDERLAAELVAKEQHYLDASTLGVQPERPLDGARSAKSHSAPGLDSSADEKIHSAFVEELEVSHGEAPWSESQRSHRGPSEVSAHAASPHSSRQQATPGLGAGLGQSEQDAGDAPIVLGDDEPQFELNETPISGQTEL